MDISPLHVAAPAAITPVPVNVTDVTPKINVPFAGSVIATVTDVVPLGGSPHDFGELLELDELLLDEQHDGHPPRITIRSPGLGISSNPLPNHR